MVQASIKEGLVLWCPWLRDTATRDDEDEFMGFDVLDNEGDCVRVCCCSPRDTQANSSLVNCSCRYLLDGIMMTLSCGHLQFIQCMSSI
jgi:hypothetical protein